MVTRAVVTHNVDAADIRSARWIGDEHQFHAVGSTINLRTNLCSSEGKTKITEVLIEGLGRLGHVVGVVSLACFDLHQRLEFIVLAEVVAFHGDFRHHKTVTFGHVDGDAYVLLVRRNGNLSRVNPKL